MQFKPGTILIFMDNVKYLSVVIGLDEEKVICYDVQDGSIMTFNRTFILQHFLFL